MSFSTHQRVARAARNNACWCAAVCRGHGDEGQMGDALWLHLAPAPRFYPNAVTLLAEPELVTPGLRALWTAGGTHAWAVKDSFDRLDLTGAGGQTLFRAQWLWLDADAASALAARVSCDGWARVADAATLAQWERAWDPQPAGPRVFVSALLQNADVALLGSSVGGELRSGAIAYRAAGVVGLSNLFGPESDTLAGVTAAAGAASRAFPGLPIVDYATGAALQAAQQAGFVSVGPLRVWTAAQPSEPRA